MGGELMFRLWTCIWVFRLICLLFGFVFLDFGQNLGPHLKVFKCTLEGLGYPVKYIYIYIFLFLLYRPPSSSYGL